MNRSKQGPVQQTKLREGSDMFQHSINAASFVSVLIAAFTFSFSLAGVAAAQDQNTTLGAGPLQNNTTGRLNTASGFNALFLNTTGGANTASGNEALGSNTTGSFNTAIGAFADVSDGNLNNATAIGFNAVVDASNKVRLGGDQVAVIEGQVAFSSIADQTQKENFQPDDAEEG